MMLLNLNLTIQINDEFKQRYEDTNINFKPLGNEVMLGVCKLLVLAYRITNDDQAMVKDFHLQEVILPEVPEIPPIVETVIPTIEIPVQDFAKTLPTPAE